MKRVVSIACLSITLALSAPLAAQIDLLGLPTISLEQRLEQQKKDVQNNSLQNNSLSSPTLPTPEAADISAANSEEALIENVIPDSQPSFIDQAGITQIKLITGLKSIGTPRRDALAIPNNAWQNFNFSTLDQLRPLHNPYMRQAWRDVLLSHASVPLGIAEITFMAHRLAALLRLGFIEDAYRLVEQAGLHQKTLTQDDPRLSSIAAISLWRQDWARLCDLPSLMDFVGKKRHIVCLLYQDHTKQAALQLQLLKEQANQNMSAIDAQSLNEFVLLANMIILQENLLPAGIRIEPTILNIALVQMGRITAFDGQTVHDFDAEHTEDTALRFQMLLQQTDISLDDRLTIAEAALRQGVIDPMTLVRIQSALPFNNNERQTITELVGRFYAQRARALVVQELQNIENAIDVRMLIAASLQAAAAADDYGLMLNNLSAYANKLNPLPYHDLTLRRAALAWGIDVTTTTKNSAHNDTETTHLALLDVLDHWQNLQPPQSVNATQSTIVDRDFLQSLLNEDLELTARQNTTVINDSTTQDWSSLVQNQAPHIRSLMPLATTTRQQTVAEVKTNTVTTNSPATTDQTAIAINTSGLAQVGYASALMAVTQELSGDPQNLFMALKQLAQFDTKLTKLIAGWETSIQLFTQAPTTEIPSAETPLAEAL